MQEFHILFPHFLDRCLDLKAFVTPLAYLLLTTGIMVSTISHHRSGFSTLRMVANSIIFVMLIVWVPTWGDKITAAVDASVKEVLKVEPGSIHAQYMAALEMKKATDGDRAWWERLFQLGPAMFEHLLSAFFLFMGWLGAALAWWAYTLQTAIL